MLNKVRNTMRTIGAGAAMAAAMPMNVWAAGNQGDTGQDLGRVVQPIIDLLNTIFNVAIPLVGAIGAIYCIFLGLKLAKADEQQERDKAKQALKNAIIGFLLIFILVVALRIGLPIMITWANAQG